MKVTIFHRADRDRFQEFDKAERPALHAAYTYTIDNATLLEDSPHDGIFRMNNAVTGNELNVQAEMPSLSVGDVVEIYWDDDFDPGATRRIYWTVQMFGWKTLTYTEVGMARIAAKVADYVDVHLRLDPDRLNRYGLFPKINLGEADTLYKEIAA
jgi:hypothetical protein